MTVSALGYWILIVSFAKGSEGGLYLAQLDCKTQTISHVQHITQGVNRPIFARFSADGKQLFVVDNKGDDPKTKFGALAIYQFDRNTGKLTLQSRTSTLGRGPCYVGLTSKMALIANYSQGSVTAIAYDASGALDGAETFAHTGSSLDPRRQKSPHPHSFVPSPDGRFGLSADLGTDEIWVYPLGKNPLMDQVASKIKITPAPGTPGTPTSPGSGPRHIAFSNDGKLLFVVSELDNMLASFKWDQASGQATAADVQSTLPKDFEGTSYGADIHMNPNMPIIYTSNRGLDSIAVFAHDDQGKLQRKAIVPSGGGHPRGVAITNEGEFLLVANRDANNVVLFHIDSQTGMLINTDKTLEVPMPMCITTLPRH